MSSRFVQNKGMWARSVGQELGSPQLPFPSPAGAGTPCRAQLCEGAHPPPENPMGADEAGLGKGSRHSEMGKGNGNSKCNLIFVAVINQHRNQILRLP